MHCPFDSADLVTWCMIIGVPEVSVSDTVSLFKNQMMAALEKSLGVDRRFSVARFALV